MSLQTPQYPGLEPNANRGPVINAVGITFMCLVFATISLRFFSRIYTHIAIAIDDWLILAATAFSWCFTILCFVGVNYVHYGQHVGKASAKDVVNFRKILYLMGISYVPALTLSKVSLLALYWRIFRVTTARRPMQIAAALNIAWSIAAGIVSVVPYIPIQGFWNRKIHGKHIDYSIFYISNQVIAIVLGLVVLFIPVYFISNLQRSFFRRISISSTFLLGLIVTIVQGFKLWRLVLVERLPSPDPTFNEVDTGLWGVVELNLWVIVASLPALRPLVNKIVSDHTSQNKSSPSQRYGNLNPIERGQKGSSLGIRYFKHAKAQGTLNYNQNGDHSASKPEDRAENGTWPRLKSKYDVRVSAPYRQENGWTPLDGANAADIENFDGIMVQREVEISRPESAYHTA